MCMFYYMYLLYIIPPFLIRTLFKCTYTRCSVLQCVVVCCNVVQCVAVCCSVLQCVAVCCSVLQCVAVCYQMEIYQVWERKVRMFWVSMIYIHMHHTFMCMYTYIITLMCVWYTRTITSVWTHAHYTRCMYTRRSHTCYTQYTHEHMRIAHTHTSTRTQTWSTTLQHD